MIDFIVGPCGWNSMAPVQLRLQALAGISTWEKYSTARFLNGSEPNILDTLRFPEFELESGIQVELLSELQTKRWKDVGLRLATSSDIRKLDFQENLKQSLSLIHGVQSLFGTVVGLCRSIHALTGHDANFDSSYSDPHLPFSIFVSCPPATEINRVERMAEGVAHEALHLQLSLVETAAPVVVDTPDSTHLFSPWKDEFRTVHGLLHGVYVYGNLRHFWNCIATHSNEYSSFARARTEEIDIELETAKDLTLNPALTPIGQRLVASLIGSS